MVSSRDWGRGRTKKISWFERFFFSEGDSIMHSGRRF
jgi:hypothetical protein